MAGSYFGKYQLLAQLGEGGMAEVFLAVVAGPRGSGFSKMTVVKRLRASFEDDPEFINMLVDEARIAARLNHPNVVQTHEVGDVDGKYFLSMEYLDGQSFNRIQNRASSILKKSREDSSIKPSGWTKEMEYVVCLDVLAGLHHAHELVDYDGSPVSIVHRDVTPQNVFITYEGQVKVVDFGIAKAAGRGAETRHGVIKGKLRYMAPEQALGKAVDRRADLFAVGVLLWEAATGERRWKNQTDAEIVNALVSEDAYISPRSVDPTCPIEIDAMCQKALASNPEDRYQTAEEFRLDLEQYVNSTGKLGESRSKLGAKVAELFKDKRAELKSVIEKQLSAASSPQGGSEVTPMMLTLHGSDRERSSRRMLQIDGVAAQTSPSSNAPPPKSSMRIGMIAGAAAIAAAVVVAVALRGRTADVPPTAAAIATPVTNETGGRIAVSISASPSNARISVDGNSVFSPYEAKLERSATPHVVRIEADGYEPQTKSIVFDRDLTLSVALDKPVAVAADRPATAAPAMPGAGGAPSRPSFAASPSFGGTAGRTAAKVATAEPAPAPPPVAPAPTAAAPRDPAAAATATTPRSKKDIDRSNPFQGASSGTGPVKGIDKSNPFGQ
jgi:serine/threonine-protein kinase